MILETYVQYFAKNAAAFGYDAGWYVVEVTDCDTIISGDNDRAGNVVPFDSRRRAVQRLDLHR